MIAGIVVIAETIRSLRSSQLLKLDFHIVAGIVPFRSQETYDRCDRHDRYDRCGMVSIEGGGGGGGGNLPIF